MHMKFCVSLLIVLYYSISIENVVLATKPSTSTSTSTSGLDTTSYVEANRKDFTRADASAAAFQYTQWSYQHQTRIRCARTTSSKSPTTSNGKSNYNSWCTTTAPRTCRVEGVLVFGGRSVVNDNNYGLHSSFRLLIRRGHNCTTHSANFALRDQVSWASLTVVSRPSIPLYWIDPTDSARAYDSLIDPWDYYPNNTYHDNIRYRQSGSKYPSAYLIRAPYKHDYPTAMQSAATKHYISGHNEFKSYVDTVRGQHDTLAAQSKGQFYTEWYNGPAMTTVKKGTRNGIPTPTSAITARSGQRIIPLSTEHVRRVLLAHPEPVRREIVWHIVPESPYQSGASLARPLYRPYLELIETGSESDSTSYEDTTISTAASKQSTSALGTNAYYGWPRRFLSKPRQGRRQNFIMFGGYTGEAGPGKPESYRNETYLLTLRPSATCDGPQVSSSNFQSLYHLLHGTSSRVPFELEYSELELHGPKPPGRHMHIMHQVGPLLIMHGGLGANGYLADLHVLDTRGVFEAADNEQGSVRANCSVIGTPKVKCFKGTYSNYHSSNGYRNQLHQNRKQSYSNRHHNNSYNTNNWSTPCTVEESRLTPNTCSCFVAVEKNNGSQCREVNKGVVNKQWQLVVPSGKAPSARASHASAVLRYGGNVYISIYGGKDEGGMLQDTHLLRTGCTYDSTGEITCGKVTNGTLPAPETEADAAHSSHVNRTEAVKEHFKEARFGWIKLNCSGTRPEPGTRIGHGAFAFDKPETNTSFVFGGYGAEQYYWINYNKRSNLTGATLPPKRHKSKLQSSVHSVSFGPPYTSVAALDLAAIANGDTDSSKTMINCEWKKAKFSSGSLKQPTRSFAYTVMSDNKVFEIGGANNAMSDVFCAPRWDATDTLLKCAKKRPSLFTGEWSVLGF
jgi:hypothetical protein